LAQHSQALIHSGHHLLHGSTNAVGLSAAWLQRQMLECFLLNYIHINNEVTSTTVE
jgi:hypothetical protein